MLHNEDKVGCKGEEKIASVDKSRCGEKMIEGDKVGNITMKMDASKLMEIMLYGLQKFSLTHIQEAHNGLQRKIFGEIGGPAVETTPTITNVVENLFPQIMAHGPRVEQHPTKTNISKFDSIPLMTERNMGLSVGSRHVHIGYTHALVESPAPRSLTHSPLAQEHVGHDGFGDSMVEPELALEGSGASQPSCFAKVTTTGSLEATVVKCMIPLLSSSLNGTMTESELMQETHGA